MRSILILTVMLMTEASWAENWQPLIVCDDGAAVLDVNADARTNLQLVIRNQNILGYLHQVGAIALRYGQNELVLRGQEERGVFNSNDFRSASNFGNVHFFREGEGIKVVFSADTRCWTEYPPGSSCAENPLSMSCESAGRMRCEPGRERANWYFRRCQ